MNYYTLNLDMKVNKYFYLHEFVSPSLLAQKNPERFITPQMIGAATVIREHFNRPVKINSYGFFCAYLEAAMRSIYQKNRGARHYLSQPKNGATYSDHLYGNAIDFNVSGVSDAEVYAEICLGSSLYKKLNDASGVNTIEDIEYTPGWIHIARRPRLIAGEFHYKIEKPTIIKP